MTTLYPHQQKIISKDPKKVLLPLGAGSGKTRIALLLARGKTLIIAPKTQRDDANWPREVRKLGLALQITVMSKEDFRRDYTSLPRFDTVIIDECFPGGTKVLTSEGYKCIENIKKGESVVNLHQTRTGKVVGIMKKQTNLLYSIYLSNKKTIRVTGNHPFLTIDKGWVQAQHLSNSDVLVSKGMLEWEYEQKSGLSPFLYYLRQADKALLASWRTVRSIQKNLQPRVLGDSQCSSYRDSDEGLQKSKRTDIEGIFRKNEEKQSNEESKDAIKNFRDSQANGSSTRLSRRQRSRDVSSSKNTSSCLGEWMDRRVFPGHKNQKGTRISDLLQNRYRQSKKENSHRSRRGISQPDLSQGARPKKNSAADFIRVEGIEIQECSNTFVYNLSIAGHPSYVVEGVLVHNCHTVTGATPNVRWRKGEPVPKCSQIFEAVQSYIEKHQPSRLYLATATPARNPMNIWAAAILLGHDWDFYKFRSAFYVRLKMPGREVFRPKQDAATKHRLATAVMRLSEGHIGRLEDYFDVPEQTVEYRHCPLSRAQIEAIDGLPLLFPDPLVLVGKTHQVENGFLIEDPERPYKVFPSTKIAAIDSLVAEYPKVLIFCRYKAQMWMLHHHFYKQGIETFVLSGETKDRQTVIAKAESSKRCVFIAQSQISTGYELPSFRCTIFASSSYSSVDDVQSRGRTLRANALAENKYVYLYSGEIDEAVIECLKNHEDFSELLYAKKRATVSDSV